MMKEDLEGLVQNWGETATSAERKGDDDDAAVFHLCANELDFILNEGVKDS